MLGTFYIFYFNRLLKIFVQTVIIFFIFGADFIHDLNLGIQEHFF